MGDGRDERAGAVVLGSRARREVPADEFSELEFVLAVTDAEPLLAEAGWTAEIAPVLMTFVDAHGDDSAEQAAREELLPGA